MKDSKFWIWFIPLFAIACIGIYLLLSKSTQTGNNTDNVSDAIKIKEEYLKGNNNYYNVNLSDNNVYKYINVNDLKELINSKEGLVFIGNSKDNITRKNIVVLDEVVSSTSIPEVYYIDLKDINEEVKKIILEKANVDNINSGTLIAVESGKILNFYYPSFIENNKDLSSEERKKIFNDYKGIVDHFIEECNEDC